MRHVSRFIGPQRRLLRWRGGYTLLELLIASVLIATLMAAAWSLMSMYSSFLVAGRAQAAEQQLSRSVMDLLATDLRAVAPAPLERTLPATGVSALQSESTRDSSATLSGIQRPPNDRESGLAGAPGASARELTAETVPPLPEIPFRGDDRSLSLISVRREPDFDSLQAATFSDSAIPTDGGIDSGFGDSGDAARDDRLPDRAAAADWRQVVYRFVPPRAERSDDRELPPGLHRFEIPIEYLGMLTQPSEFVDDRDRGFGESAGDVLGEFPADAIERLRAQGITEATHEHIPEVVACRFEFFSDATWQLHWEATPDRDRPVAVRVSVGLLSSSEHRELGELLGAETADESSTDGAARAASPGDAGNDTDPFAAFHPSQYRRTILMELARDIRQSRDAESTGASSSVVPSLLGSGGGR